LVRETAAKLKAEVVFRTESGHGTTVEMLVPVSLLSLRAVMVEDGGVSASLPLDAVQQTLRLSDAAVVHGPQGDTIQFDGKTVPFLSLAQALGQQPARKTARGAVLGAFIYHRR
jgi:two-component system chemotaxis sensor kinase CheA